MAELVKERRWLPSLSLPRMAPYGLLAIVAFLVLYPLGMLIFGSLSTRLPLSEGNELTFQNFATVFSSTTVLKVFLTTVALAVPRVMIALAFATGFAWILARTNTPAKGWLEGLMVFMFFLPGLPWVIAWRLMAAPHSGFLNILVFAHLPGNIELNVYSYAGIIILGGVRIAPIMYLFVAPAFKAMDASLEESSRMAGAGALTTIRRVNVPLAMPALLGQAIMAFVAMLESFELEFLLGTPAGIWVYTTEVWRRLYASVPPEYGTPAAMSLALLVVTFGLVVLQWRVLGSRIYTVVTGRGYQARPYDLGRWRWATFSFILLFFLFFVALPFAVLLLNSFSFVSGFYSWNKAYYTLDWWRNTFQFGLAKPLRNTVILGVAAASLGVVMTAMVSYLVTRTRWRLRKVLDLLSWTPFTVPAVVMALGFFWAYVFLPIPIYGTIWVLVLVMATRGLPFAGRVLNSTMVQIGPELEESSRIHGASWAQTFREVMIPLLRPAFIYAWVLLFVMAVRDLETVIFLYAPGSRVLSTEIYQFSQAGRPEMAIALSLIQTALIIVAYVVAQRFSPRGKLA